KNPRIDGMFAMQRIFILFLILLSATVSCQSQPTMLPEYSLVYVSEDCALAYLDMHSRLHQLESERKTKSGAFLAAFPASYFFWPFLILPLIGVPMVERNYAEKKQKVVENWKMIYCSNEEIPDSASVSFDSK